MKSNLMIILGIMLMILGVVTGTTIFQYTNIDWDIYQIICSLTSFIGLILVVSGLGSLNLKKARSEDE